MQDISILNTHDRALLLHFNKTFFSTLPKLDHLQKLRHLPIEVLKVQEQK